MVKVLDLLEDYVSHAGYAYERLDGGTRASDRAGAVERFNRPAYRRFVRLPPLLDARARHATTVTCLRDAALPLLARRRVVLLLVVSRRDAALPSPHALSRRVTRSQSL